MKRYLALALSMALVACSGINNQAQNNNWQQSTPTVDFVEQLDVFTAHHRDSFLNMLALNYRSYAIFNARELGDAMMGELFANKAITAFSGDVPMPEAPTNWPIHDPQMQFEMTNGFNELMAALRRDAAEDCPEVAADAQSKFDCWVTATAMGRMPTANECRDRFGRAMAALRNPATCRNVITTARPNVPGAPPAPPARAFPQFYPDTGGLSSVAHASRARDGVIIVNNVNIPEHIINPVPVQPIVFNQNIFGGGNVSNCVDDECWYEYDDHWHTPTPVQLGDQFVTRDEFINMMMALRGELVAINERLDNLPGERATIKVQQIPQSPTQHLMEEIFEIRFDFDRYNIKPEYRQMINQLVATTNRHRNVRISVVGHTDTVGSDAHNWALGGRRAQAVRDEMIRLGVPAGQIVAVSAGLHDPKIDTGPGVANRENRRVRVVKETHWTEEQPPIITERVVMH